MQWTQTKTIDIDSKCVEIDIFVMYINLYKLHIYKILYYCIITIEYIMISVYITFINWIKTEKSKNRHYTGKETVWCFQQFSPGAPVGCSFFSLFLLLWKRLATRLSLVSCQGAWRRAFFFEKLNFFQLEKTLWAAEKDAGGGVLKALRTFLKTRFTP